MKKTLEILKKRSTYVFNRDFPFYFCIAGRMSHNRLEFKTSILFKDKKIPWLDDV